MLTVPSLTFCLVDSIGNPLKILSHQRNRVYAVRCM